MSESLLLQETGAGHFLLETGAGRILLEASTVTAADASFGSRQPDMLMNLLRDDDETVALLAAIL